MFSRSPNTGRQNNSWKALCTKWAAERDHLHMLEKVKEAGNLGGPNTSLEQMGMLAPRLNNMPKSPAAIYTLIMRTFWKQAWITRTRGGKQLPIHSLKWNPNDVLTTCKAIYEVLVSGYTSYACADVACSNGTRTKLWRPKAADSVLSLPLGDWRIDRVLHFYHVFVHFASYKDKSLLSEFFSRKVEL